MSRGGHRRSSGNRIVHGYWEVDLDIVVATVRHQIPPLIAQLRAIENADGDDD